MQCVLCVTVPVSLTVTASCADACEQGINKMPVVVVCCYDICCFFIMCRSRVYIAYLDSVHFFRPRHFRTEVYHDLLIGYLDYVKSIGWVCVILKAACRGVLYNRLRCRLFTWVIRLHWGQWEKLHLGFSRNLSIRFGQNSQNRRSSWPSRFY